MKKSLAVAVVVAMLAVLGATASAAPPKDPPAQAKVLIGKVLDAADNPLAGSVVYLTNTRTRAVKTYIAGREGDFRFPGLTENTDYEVYAQYQGHKSDTKSVSQFDARATVSVNFKIDVK